MGKKAMKFSVSRIALVSLCAVLLSVASAPARAADGVDAKALDEAVARVLQERPELVLQALESRPAEFVEILQKSMEIKKQQDFIADIQSKIKSPLHPKIDPKRPYRGAKDGSITVALYSNYGCPYCKRANAILDQLMEKYPNKVKMVLKHFPFEAVTEKCALVFEVLARQDMQKAWDFHEFLFENRGVLHKEGMAGVDTLMRKFGLDVAAMNKEIAKPEIQAALKADMEEVQQMGASGAPVLVINGVMVDGARPLETLEQVIGLIEAQGKQPADTKE